MKARVMRYRAPSGDPDADYWYAKCECGWQGTYHSNRTIEGRELAARDLADHLARHPEAD